MEAGSAAWPKRRTGPTRGLVGWGPSILEAIFSARATDAESGSITGNDQRAT